MVVAIRAGRLLDGSGSAPVLDAVVLVEGERITAVGTAAEVGIPSQAEIIDLADQTLLPGFIDAHTHITVRPWLGNQQGQMMQAPEKQVLRGVSNLRRMLRSGVTTARIMGEEYFLDVEIRRAVQSGDLVGPRLLTCTRPLAASNGHGVAITKSDGPDTIRRVARENLAAGADFLKTFVTGGMSSSGTGVNRRFYNDAELAAIVEEAEYAGTYVAAHAHGGAGMRSCLQLGVRTLEHTGFATDADIDLAMTKDAWFIGTFAILFHPMGIEGGGDFGIADIREKVMWARDVLGENWGRIIRSGMNWALGTDSVHGYLAYNAIKAVEWGATPMDALLGITGRAAEACRVADNVGTVQVGKLADLVAVQGNPLEQIGALERVGFVMKGGQRYDRLSAE